MRLAMGLTVLTAFGLAGCSQANDVEADADADTVVEANGASQTSTPAPAATSTLAPGSISLSAEAVTVNGPAGTKLAVGSLRRAVDTELTKALGEPIGRDSNEECGAGPIQSTYFTNGLQVNFMDDKLVGWIVDGDGASGGIATAENIGIGSSIADVTNVYTLEEMSDSTLGDEFYTDEGIGGVFNGEGDAKTVATLYAGTNCFFR